MFLLLFPSGHGFALSRTLASEATCSNVLGEHLLFGPYVRKRQPTVARDLVTGVLQRALELPRTGPRGAPEHSRERNFLSRTS